MVLHPRLQHPFHPPFPLAKGPAVWRGPELSATVTTAELDAGHVRELEQALRVARQRDVPLLRLTHEDFPLPRTAALLRRLAKKLEHGRGFVLLKGLPVERLGTADVSTVFWCVGRHLGVAVSQNAAGHMLGHVMDTGRDLADPATRGYQTRAALPFHSDPADVTALLQLSAPRTGGRISLVSSGALHNAVLERRPDLAARLFRRHRLDRREEHEPGELPWHELPLAVWQDGRLSLRYDRLRLDSARRFRQEPRPQPADAELFDLLDDLAASPGFRHELQLEVGDVLLLNNHAVLHSREAFEDGPDPAHRRHLLRLWLTPHQPRSLPDAFWGGATAAGAGRGGVPPCDVVSPVRAPLAHFPSRPSALTSVR
ncbi:TauD/TfdA family dioxygenase [Streptacidiphilus jiangxiensis]|uniref:Taurine dioxygenase, alpha-ketoglutarate-dependent n=1 Tax=Streptacidiphilus jiangxiensis TaxID=235985 RepID=A0A1H7YY55_STRJI|nr:TauD/TfdA family dioxygenase [Streptacidiphilus jiangxiensis]SEM50895.1 Taurine dioxygenase, alpha-ketoglutarate-dependent [Streptacidiphilus jiangxiensis]